MKNFLAGGVKNYILILHMIYIIILVRSDPGPKLLQPIDASKDSAHDPGTLSDGEFDRISISRSTTDARIKGVLRQFSFDAEKENFQDKGEFGESHVTQRKRKRKKDKFDVEDKPPDIVDEELQLQSDDNSSIESLGFTVPTGFKFQRLRSACDEQQVSDSQTDESVGST